MISGIFIEGFIYGIMVLGVFGTFRVLNFADMTVDGSFPLGACVFAACLIHGIPAPLGLLIAFLSGLVAGQITSLIYTRLHVPDLLSGILTMTMLYSVNLRILGGKSNVSYLKYPNLFTNINNWSEKTFAAAIQKYTSLLSSSSDFSAFSKWLYNTLATDILPSLGLILFLFAVIVVLKVILDIFFHTDLGLTMGALGSNQQLIISQGVDPDSVRTIGICFSNGLASLSGAFASMYNGFADISSGTGIVVSGLASLMLGEFILHSNKISLQTLRVLIGSIIYRAIMVLARSYGYKIHMTPNDLKLVTGILIIICLIVSRLNISQKIHAYKDAKHAGYADAKKETATEQGQ